MLKRRVIALVALSMFIISLSGCAAGRKEQNIEMQGLKNQVAVLESQIQSKDEEINSLKEALCKAGEEKTSAKITQSGKVRVVPEIKSRPNARQIQAALKNAGYAPGAIDGKMGAQTKDAVRAFQKANNLPSDGKVGAKTWEVLKEYLYKKVK